ncbi:UPF0481 protein At3g47200 [Ricinus communis]|uniref:UPF0481 protein At3g47200 n=1 Tax=Ricinus communis TaxID=3988 RepID=UPI00201ADE4A|nr:UPF0481 protein At3g47200 [Ricinus communis]
MSPGRALTNWKYGSTSRQTQHPHVELTIDIPDDLETSMQDDFCIYSVPPTLRQIYPEAYTQVISIGPIHYGKQKLQAMQIQKLRYLKEFCKRKMLKVNKSSSDHDEIKEKEIEREFSTDLLNEINVEEMRRCYADNFEFCSTEFVNMILLDSVFILELFMRHHKDSKNQKDFVLGKPWLRTDVQQDLVLLENQLPFSSLEKLYNFAKPNFVNEKDYPSLLELTVIISPISSPRIPKYRTLRKCYISLIYIGSLYSITKLHQAGLKLKPAQNKCFLEIGFEPGITCLWRAELQFPCFEVDDTTEFVVRNLMALEQCHYPYETYICNYIRLWDLLIDTAEDVDLLVEKKNLVNGLGDGATVANLVNKLCNQIAEVQSCYYPLSKDLNEYYEHCGNQTMAILRKVYFGDLWRGTGTVAAVLLLILTIIQAACSILQL